MSTEHPLVSDTDSQTGTIAPTVEQLAAEQAGMFDLPSVDLLPPAPGEPMFPPHSTIPLFALSLVSIADAPGLRGCEVMDAQEQATDQTASPGTLYPILKEYRGDGLLIETALAQGNRQQVDDAAAVDQALAEYEQRLRWWLRLVRTARESIDV